MKKKLLSIVLTLCLVFDCVTSIPKISYAQTINENVSIGDTYSGFKVTEVDSIKTGNTQRILLEHKKTGARMLVLKNNDKNRGFMIKFNTPAENDKGISHIIEHCVLSGSKKYPGKSTCFDIMQNTYVTNVNGMTTQNFTVYPVCSMSEKQLMKLSDIYLDAVYNPLFLTDKRIFEREGIRYELSDEKSKLTRTGIVYNEMKAYLSNIEYVANFNTKRAILPKSNQRFECGGYPSAVEKLTYKEVVRTYKKYYNPSNSLMLLYGDVDYKAFLKMINDDYLTQYKKQVIKITREEQKGTGKLIEKTYEFPVGKKDKTKNKSIIDVAFLLKDRKKADYMDEYTLMLAINLLNADNSKFKMALMNSKIGETYSIDAEWDLFQPVLHIMALNADPSKKKQFYNLVLKELKATIKSGIDKQQIDSMFSTSKYSDALNDNGSLGETLMLESCIFDTLHNDVMLDDDAIIQSIEKKKDKHVIEDQIKKQIIDNKNRAIVVTTPKAGLIETNEKKNKELLEKKKASMSTKEKKALVKATKDINKWNKKKTPSDVIKSMQAVNLEDMDTEVKDYNIKETKINTATLYTADADVQDVSYSEIYYDESHLNEEELYYLQFYTDLITYGMPTTKRSADQVINDKTRDALGFNIDVNAYKDNPNGTKAHAVLSVGYYCLNNGFDKALDLTSDVLLYTDLTKMNDYASNELAKLKVNYEYQLSEPNNLIASRAMAYTNEYYRYVNYLHGLDYYDFILDLEKVMNTDPNSVIKKLEEVRAKAFNKQNLRIAYVGNSKDDYAKSLKTYIDNMQVGNYQKAAIDLPRPAKREALEINSDVQYIYTNSSLLTNQVSKSGVNNVISMMLNSELFIPKIRSQGGAYDAYADFSMDNYYVNTYRDPNYANSLCVIKDSDIALADLLKNMNSDSIEGFKLSTYARFTTPYGELMDGAYSVSNYMAGFKQADIVKKLNEIKKTTLEEVKEFVPMLATLNKDMNYVVAASKADIEAHKDLFDKVIKVN